jgi:hypothetical protein
MDSFERFELLQKLVVLEVRNGGTGFDVVAPIVLAYFGAESVDFLINVGVGH